MTTFLFDMSNLVYSTATGLFAKNGDQFDTPYLRGAILARLKDIRTKLKIQKTDEMVLAFDSNTYWRRDIFPHYKGARKRARDKDAMDWDALFRAYAELKMELVANCPWKCLEVDGAEADDLIAVLTRRLAPHGDVVIVSSDKDFLQLQDKKLPIKQWSIRTGKFLKPNEYDLFEHIVKGDAGDGIPNILSEDDTLVVEGKRQKSVFEKDLTEWKKVRDPDKFCRDMDMLNRFDINRRLIDLTYIPENIAQKIVAAYDTTVPAKGKLQNWIISSRLIRLLPL